MYTVDQYLTRLRLAKRSEMTILSYRNAFLSFARFLGVPIEELHMHLLPDNLINYAGERAGRSERGTRVRLSILHRYYTINKVKLDKLEIEIVKAQRPSEPQDKPLDLATLQKMMDLGTAQSKAILSVLISTGMRAGECCQIKIGDVNGDTIRIRNEIAKGNRGGLVYLTAEAREYLDLWMKDRERHGQVAKTRTFSKHLPEHDERLFLCAYPTLRQMFARLYDSVDGERGKYHHRCTVHSCRRFFRTQAVKTMPLDVVEKILRHTGYLTGSYVRISDEEARKEFHDGEAALYITRADHRIQGSKLDALARENKELREIVQAVQKREMQKLDSVSLSAEDLEIVKKMVLEDLAKNATPSQ